jgi:uncharacterized protein (TIGR03067 family)
MKTRIVLLAVAALSIPLASASVAFADDLSGKWKVKQATFNGEDLVFINAPMVTFKDGSVTIVIGSKQVLKGTYTLDAGKDPKQIDVSPTSVGKFPPFEAGKESKGIYKVDSKSTVTMCIAAPGSDRPDKFESPKGKNWLLMIMDYVD